MRRSIDPFVYLLASRRNGTLYLGVTSNLMQRIAQHRAETLGGFTAQHGVKLLVWYEQHATMDNAILREKQIKKWRRSWKLDLIEQANPDWQDLAVSLGFEPLGCLDSRVRGNDEDPRPSRRSMTKRVRAIADNRSREPCLPHLATLPNFPSGPPACPR